jgi:hypothetical protein
MKSEIQSGEKKHLSDTFPIKEGRKQGDVLSPMLLKFDSKLAIR